MTPSTLGATGVNSTLASSTVATQTSAQGASATSSTSPVAAALTKADARVQAQRDATGAQLSSLGKLKSAVSDAQLAARAMSGLAASATAVDAKATVSRFLTAFNAAVSTAKTATADMASGDASATTALSAARRVGNELGRSLVSVTGAASDALRKAGFKQGNDGTLTVDAAKLDAALKADPTAVQAALVKLGQATDAVATRDLASGGVIATPLAALNQRATALKGQHDKMITMAQNLSASSSSSTSTQSTPSTSYVNYGISAYQSNA